MQRVCRSFTGKVYDLPEDGHANATTYNQVTADIKQRMKVMKGLARISKQQLKHYLAEIQKFPDSSVSLVAFYQQFLKKEKSIFLQLNKFKREGNLIHGIFWSPLNHP